MLYLTINTKINILVYMSEDKIKLLIVLFLHILIFLFCFTEMIYITFMKYYLVISQSKSYLSIKYNSHLLSLFIN